MNKLRAVPREELMIDGLLVIEAEGCDEVVALVSYEQDAEFIVKACNAHAKLVEALKHIAMEREGSDLGDFAEDALKAAGVL